jgi:hypothetical protein
MNVRYGDKVGQGGGGYHFLQEATKRLEEVLGPSTKRLEEAFGPSSGEVTIAWDRSADERGRPRYTLTLSDFTGRVSADFAPAEFASPGHLRYRLLDLWGDLLQRRSEAQVRRLQDLVKQGE